MSNMPAQPPPQQKLTPDYIYNMERRVRELEAQNSQLRDLLSRIDKEFDQVVGEMEVHSRETLDKVTSLDSDLGVRMEEVARQAAVAQKELARQSEFIVRQQIPNTMLLSDSFWMRALAVYGHFFVINLIVGFFVSCLVFIIAMALGISLPSLPQ